MPALTDFYHEGDEKLGRKGVDKLLKTTKSMQKHVRNDANRLEELQKQHLSIDNPDLWDDI